MEHYLYMEILIITLLWMILEILHFNGINIWMDWLILDYFMPLNVQDKQLVNYRKPGLNVDFPQTIQHIQHSTECLI